MISMERCLKILEIPKEKENYLEKDENLIDYTEEKEEKNNQEKENLSLIVMDKSKKIWPSKGNIEFANYQAKYRPDMPVVLDNLNFNIFSGEKVGVVGRTGSGKSTICNSLFRIIEPHQGTIFIDGEDITGLGLSKLRQNLTIIPQDSCIFGGTLKTNVDPLGKYSDTEIYDALKMVGFNLETENEIDKEIDEQASNLSVGEKQLICIARAILRVIFFINFLEN